jgi:hypothetical protein
MPNDAAGLESKFKEDWLRQEIRASRALLVRLMEWGVVLLVAAEINLYWIRQDITLHLRDVGRLREDAILPLFQWSIGTLFLLVIAYVFARYTDRIAKHHAVYRAQLVSMTPTYSGIAESIGVDRSLHRLRYLYYAFPLFDLAVWGFDMLS